MKAALATIVFLLSSMAAIAQTTPVNYKIHVDDVLRIQVYGEAQVNVEVPVSADGYVSAPFVGSLKAEGRTTSDLEKDLVALYQAKLRIREPKVSVTFAVIHAYRAFIGGAVNRPGQYQFRPGDTILSLVHQGGDPLSDGQSEEHRAYLTRKGSDESIPIDLFAMLRKGDLSQNYELQDGDDLEIPPANNLINVAGFVQRPGPIVYREPMTLADAISGAGGEIPTKSRMSKVTILRQRTGAPGQYQLIKADFVRYVKGDATQNIELQPKDFIYVPATNTPDLNTVANTINAAFLFQNFLRGGFLGFKLFGG